MNTNSIVFIDSRVANYEALIASFSADTRWHVLDAQEDGVAQIERLLAGESDLDAIHIISHGAPGTLYIGNTVLTSSNLPDYAQRLQSVGASLTAAGDFLLYSCNVAQGSVGLRFINTLGQLTGADVTASDDISGIGGDWVVETASVPTEAIGLSSETSASALDASIVPDISLIAFTAATGTDSANPSLSFSVTLSENFSQTMSLSLLYWVVNNEQTWISLSRASSSEPFVSQVQLPEYAKSGTYEIRAISVRDNNGTQLSLSSGQLQALGHEVSTTLINPNADEVEPALGSFSAGQPYWADDGSLHIDLSVTASDAGSGLKPSFVVELTSPTGVSLQQWANFDPAGSSVVDFVLPRYAPTGSYVVNTVQLTDQAGNHSMSQPWLAQNPQVVQLINSEGDSAAPAVSAFTLSAVYDPQTHRPKIVIKGSALDEVSGLSGAYVRFSSPEGLTLDASMDADHAPGKGTVRFRRLQGFIHGVHPWYLQGAIPLCTRRGGQPHHLGK